MRRECKESQRAFQRGLPSFQDFADLNEGFRRIIFPFAGDESRQERVVFGPGCCSYNRLDWQPFRRRDGFENVEHVSWQLTLLSKVLIAIRELLDLMDVAPDLCFAIAGGGDKKE